MKSQWFYLALEYRALGYSRTDLIVTMALCLVAIPHEATSEIALAFSCNIGKDIVIEPKIGYNEEVIEAIRQCWKHPGS